MAMLRGFPGTEPGRPSATVGAVNISRLPIQRATMGIAALAVASGVLAPMQGNGLTLAVSNGQIVVWTVDPFGPAQRFGFQPGMVAVQLNGRDLVRLPQRIQPDPVSGATPDPDTGNIPTPPAYIDPTTPQRVPLADSVLQGLIDQSLWSLTAVRPGDLTTWTYDTPGNMVQIGDDGRSSLRESLATVVLGIAILFGIAYWFMSGRAGAQLRDLGLPLALATAGPFLLTPFAFLWSPLAVLLSAVLLPAAMTPLGLKLAERIESSQDRLIAVIAVTVCAVSAGLLSFALRTGAALDVSDEPTRLLAAGITLVPGIIAAGPALPRPRSVRLADGDVAASNGLLQATELAVIGITPAIALLTTVTTGTVLLLMAWVVAILLAGRFTVRPLARVARRAQLQRDLIVAATEAERARVAADIHDDALQELTLLVRRLDAAGDTDGADLARGVSDRLRAICGDLRLPILDDLGVGPALDWLVLRIERLAGGEVRLERSDGARPPADVELAFFRVAQEALSNAVKHGRPPITVRYRSSDGAASLSVDDSGAGIATDAGERAEREGHFGLLNMQQRAEGVGAILDVRRWPKGGTHVQLEWRAR
jgi:signal transduction histidine kinase